MRNKNKNKPADSVLMEEGGVKITREKVVTPYGEYPVGEIRAARLKVHRPTIGPLLLAIIGTITLAAALQGMFWGDWIAAIVMLGGGAWWAFGGVRYILVLEHGEKPVSAWYAKRREDVERALEKLLPLISRRS